MRSALNMVALLFGAGLALCAEATAITNLSVLAQSYGGISGNGYSSAGSSTGQAEDVFSDRSGPTGGTESQAIGEASFGSLHAYAASIANNTNTYFTNYVFYGSGSVVLSTNDTITISSPENIGQAGLLTFQVFNCCTGGITASGDVQGTQISSGASFHAVLGINYNQTIGDYEWAGSAGDNYGTESNSVTTEVNGVSGADPFGYFTVSIPFIFGTSFDLEMYLTVQASTFVQGDGSAAASLDAERSFDWAGVSSVTANGNPVSFSITSASGTDYLESFAPAVSNSIPESESTFLVSAGLIALVIARRQRNAINGLGAA